MRISDWSSDVCSSDLHLLPAEIKEQLFFNRVNTQGRQWQQPLALQNRFDVEPRQRHASIHRSPPRPRQLKMMSIERKSVEQGKSLSVRVDLGCRRILQKKKRNN